MSTPWAFAASAGMNAVAWLRTVFVNHDRPPSSERATRIEDRPGPSPELYVTKTPPSGPIPMIGNSCVRTYLPGPNWRTFGHDSGAETAPTGDGVAIWVSRSNVAPASEERATHSSRAGNVAVPLSANRSHAT